MDYTRVEKRIRARRHLSKGAIYGFLAIWALIVLFPFYWMVLTSIKSYGDYNSEFIPSLSR